MLQLWQKTFGNKLNFNQLISENCNSSSLGNRIGIVLIIGIVYVISLLTPGFLSGNGPYWTSIVSDRASHLIGYLYYLDADWQWPLLSIRTLSFPEGVCITFTDSIPLLAMIAKVIKIIIPHKFNFFGLWLGACYLLNGLAFLLLLDRIGIKRYIPSLVGAFLSMLTPVLLHRWYHASLNAHFLLIFSMLCYVDGYLSISQRRSLLMQLGLLICALLIHPYFVAMLFGVFLASVVQGVYRQRLSILAGIGWIGLSIFIFIVLILGLGIVTSESGSMDSGRGFSHFSINLLGPIFAIHSGLRPSGWELVRDIWELKNAWAFFGKGAPDATGGQYFEGFSYLGGGVLFLLFLSIVFLRLKVLKQIYRHWPLVLILLGMGLFALSNRIYFGENSLIHIPLPRIINGLANTFRASGRFFWPLSYALLTFGVVAVTQRFKHRTAAVLLLLALGLQWIDTIPVRKAIGFASTHPESAGLDINRWRVILDNADRLLIIPSIQCGDPELQNPKLELQLLAAHLGPIPTNSALTARSAKNCSAEAQLLLANEFDSNAVYVFFNDYKQSPELVKFIAAQGTKHMKPFSRGVFYDGRNSSDPF